MAHGEEGEIIFEGGPTCCGSPAQWWSRTQWRMTSLSIRRETGTYGGTYNFAVQFRDAIESANFIGS